MNYFIVIGGSLIILSMFFYLYKLLLFAKYSILESTSEVIVFICIGFSILIAGKYYEYEKEKILTKIEIIYLLQKNPNKRLILKKLQNKSLVFLKKYYNSMNKNI